MNRAKLLRWCTGLAHSLSSTRQLGLRRLSSTQVIYFPNPINSFPVALSRKPHTVYNLRNLLQISFYSSKAQSFIDLVLSSNVWSKEIEDELEAFDPKLTHESIVYVLVNLKGNPRKSLDFFNWACFKKGFDPRIVHYGLLLRSLASKEFIEDFWVVALEMKKKWVYYDHNVYSAVFEKLSLEGLKESLTRWTKLCRTKNELVGVNDVGKEVVNLILGSDWSEQLERILKEKLEFPLSEQLLVRIIEGLSRQPLKCLEFFKWVASCGEFELDSATYNAVAKVLAKQESMGEFWDFVKRMRGKGYEMDIDTYIRSVRHLPSKDVVELFEFVMDGPYKPSLQDCSNLLVNINRDSDLDINLVHRVVRKFVAAGNTLTKSIYDGIHRTLCNSGRFDEAKKIVEDLKDAGYEPDIITYSQEISGLCKRRKFEEASKVLEQMETKGCVADVRTWTILIRGLCLNKQMDQAVTCYAKMKDKNVPPDTKTLEVLLHGFLGENKLMDAYKFLNEVANKDNLKPIRSTYRIMIEKLSEAGKFDEALDLYKLMTQHGYVPYPDPITRYVSKYGTMDDTKKLLGTLSPKKDSPSTDAYIHLIRSFFEEGRYIEAKDLVNESPKCVQNAKKINEIFGQSKHTVLRSRKTTPLAKPFSE